ncbi:HlyD family efflux transporter periplasmic adaptor subunit [Psychrobacter sp.]|uniref:HlyD family efflux transporter periplasmic adaptor subunit n=1 Tax=Psychrobacter sp. TaxID=56811 RepID=UPI0026488484|nr:HlyD family efflux transporter periplasmic adaptor subunit [Psychrobacter sp.]MDN6308238.1 HlyD family efflux transporter periplasmic adaptor subunit [Psychrobacter sp.]
MTAAQWFKKSPYILGVLLVTACQPPPVDEPAIDDNNAKADAPLVIDDDSVTMTPDHILSIKMVRYQPSLGLQGSIEPIRQSNFIAAHSVNVRKVLVSEGQVVESGTPLFIVRRLNATDKTTENAHSVTNTDTNNYTTPEKTDTSASDLDQKATETLENVGDTEQTHAQTAMSGTETNSATTSTPETNTSADIKDHSSENANTSTASSRDSETQYNWVTVRASFAGRVEKLTAKAGQDFSARTSLLQLGDENRWRFVATLPIQAEPQLSVGQTVNFSAEEIPEKFTGQISKLTTTSQPKSLRVHVNVIDNVTSREKLLPDMQVTGRVNYGQIDVGTTVPERALHDVDLTELHKPPYKPLRPLAANIWIIGQDQRLTHQSIEVVEYNPATKQYLIAGVSNDSLIFLADLPIDAQGKRAIVS